MRVPCSPTFPHPLFSVAGAIWIGSPTREPSEVQWECVHRLDQAPRGRRVEAVPRAYLCPVLCCPPPRPSTPSRRPGRGGGRRIIGSPSPTTQPHLPRYGMPLPLTRPATRQTHPTSQLSIACWCSRTASVSTAACVESETAPCVSIVSLGVRRYHFFLGRLCQSRDVVPLPQCCESRGFSIESESSIHILVLLFSFFLLLFPLLSPLTQVKYSSPRCRIICIDLSS